MLCPNVPCQSPPFQLWPFTCPQQCWFHHWCAGNTSLLDRVLSRYFLNPILVYISSWGKETMLNLFTRGARSISPWRPALDLGSASLECWEECWGHVWAQTGKNLESHRMVLPAGVQDGEVDLLQTSLSPSAQVFIFHRQEDLAVCYFARSWQEMFSATGLFCLARTFQSADHDPNNSSGGFLVEQGGVSWGEKSFTATLTDISLCMSKAVGAVRIAFISQLLVFFL